LNITEDALKTLEEVPRGTIKVSHLEPLAPLKPQLQKEATERIVNEARFNLLCRKSCDKRSG